MSKRERGTIENVFFGTEDHGILTCSVGIDFGGSFQYFGNIALDEKLGKDFVERLCSTFSVRDLRALNGLPVFALRCFGGWNESIEGLEAESGQRFILTEWRRRHFPSSLDPLQQARESGERTIASCQRRIADERKRLAQLDADYTAWATIEALP